MRSIAVVLLVAAVVSISAATLGAQAPTADQAAPMPQPTNLQVLPKTMTGPAVLVVMRTITQGLGVQCNYCHVAEGAGGRNDMAADDKPTKKTARVMIRMTLNINDTLNDALGKKTGDGMAGLRVQCVTCHRGLPIPKAEMPPARTAAAKPAAH